LVDKIDAALFAASTTDGPSGLPSLTNVSEVDSGGTFSNYDHFAAAISASEEAGGQVGHFLMSPATALTLAKLKQSSDSNMPMLGTAATDALDRRILGVPVLVSAHCPDGDVWAMPTTTAFVVQSGGAEIAADTSVHFQEYMIAVRGV